MRIELPYELHVYFQLSPNVPPSKQTRIIEQEFDRLYESIHVNFMEVIDRKVTLSFLSFVEPKPFKLRIYTPTDRPGLVAVLYLTIVYEDEEPYTRERYEMIRKEIIDTTEYLRNRIIPDYDRYFHEHDEEDPYAIERTSRNFIGMPEVVFVPAQEALVNIPRRQRLRMLQGIPQLPQDVAWKISEYNSGPLMPNNSPARRGVAVPNYLSEETLATPFETRLARARVPTPVAPVVQPEVKQKPWWKFWGGKRTRARTRRGKRIRAHTLKKLR